MERFLYVYVIPWAVAFLLLAVGMYFVLESIPTLLDITNRASEVRQQDTAPGQQVFKDVLQTVLAIAALAIAAFGYGTYKILSTQIEEKVRKNTEGRYHMSLAHQRTELGYMNWMLFKNSKEGSEIAKGYIDGAIRHTRIAFEEHAVELDDKEHEAERLICDIRNNWAYYVSEKHYMSERYDGFVGISLREQDQFLSFVDWIEERINDHPENATEYRDTIDTVRKRFKNLNNNATARPKNKA